MGVPEFGGEPNGHAMAEWKRRQAQQAHQGEMTNYLQGAAAKKPDEVRVNARAKIIAARKGHADVMFEDLQEALRIEAEKL